MVLPRSRQKSNGDFLRILRRWSLPAVGILALIGLFMNSMPDMSSQIAAKNNGDVVILSKKAGSSKDNAADSVSADSEDGNSFDMSESELEEIESNTKAFSTWLTKFSTSCEGFSELTNIVSFVSESLIPSGESAQKDKGLARGIKRCKNVFIDFGANIGDSVGKFIDSDLLDCTQNGQGARYDVEKLEFISGKYNRISTSFKQAAKETGTRPHEFCIYGVEGNPVFTDRLKKMEDHIMSMSPRPAQNVHILTEHVGTNEDGPTKLYLDTVNEENNFWGSSILESHQDVQKSATEVTDGKVTAADVTGITLTTLMDQTLVAFTPDATNEQMTGGHLIVKVDIEGGEYQLMEEVANSGKLCEFKKMGNTIDLIVEYHRMSITDASVRNPLLASKKKTEDKLKECGVEMKALGANWK